MTNQRVTQVKVRCSRGIANEMCRYDGSKVVHELLLESKWEGLVDKWIAEGKIKAGVDAEEVKEQHRVYEFIIEGVHHTVARWSSFGVKVQPV